MTTTITTLDEFLALFPSAAEASRFEDQVLSAGREYLPACALAVLEDNSVDPAPEYWAFLASQAALMSEEWAEHQRVLADAEVAQ